MDALGQSRTKMFMEMKEINIFETNQRYNHNFCPVYKEFFFLIREQHCATIYFTQSISDVIILCKLH